MVMGDGHLFVHLRANRVEVALVPTPCGCEYWFEFDSSIVVTENGNVIDGLAGDVSLEELLQREEFRSVRILC